MKPRFTGDHPENCQVLRGKVLEAECFVCPCEAQNQIPFNIQYIYIMYMRFICDNMYNIPLYLSIYLAS
jgi:hypothetical protein